MLPYFSSRWKKNEKPEKEQYREAETALGKSA